MGIHHVFLHKGSPLLDGYPLLTPSLGTTVIEWLTITHFLIRDHHDWIVINHSLLHLESPSPIGHQILISSVWSQHMIVWVLDEPIVVIGSRFFSSHFVMYWAAKVSTTTNGTYSFSPPLFLHWSIWNPLWYWFWRCHYCVSFNFIWLFMDWSKYST